MVATSGAHWTRSISSTSNLPNADARLYDDSTGLSGYTRARKLTFRRGTFRLSIALPTIAPCLPGQGYRLPAQMGCRCSLRVDRCAQPALPQKCPCYRHVTLRPCAAPRCSWWLKRALPWPGPQIFLEVSMAAHTRVPVKIALPRRQNMNIPLWTGYRADVSPGGRKAATFYIAVRCWSF